MLIYALRKHGGLYDNASQTCIFSQVIGPLESDPNNLCITLIGLQIPNITLVATKVSVTLRSIIVLT